MSRSGDGRFNYFMLDAAGGSYVTPMILSYALGGQTLFDGVPAVNPESVRIHGLRRLEMTSNYINARGQDLVDFAGWTRLIRDWYAPNHVLYSGSIEAAICLPGVRVGERLDLVLSNGDVMQFYVEGVDHEFEVLEDGSHECFTRLTVTRGSKNPVEDLQAVLTGFESSDSPLLSSDERQIVDLGEGFEGLGEALEFVRRVARGEIQGDEGEIPVVEPADLDVTTPGGATITIPREQD